MTRKETLAAEQRNSLVIRQLPLALTMAKRAKLRLPDSFDVEDLAQHGTLGLMKAASRYLLTKWDARGRPPFDAFARRYVWGAIIDSCRRRHFANAKFARLDDAGVSQVVSRPDDVDGRLDAERRRRVVREVVAMLPETERQVVALRYTGERTQCEIGAAVGQGKYRVAEIHRGALAVVKRGLVARGVKTAA